MLFETLTVIGLIELRHASIFSALGGGDSDSCVFPGKNIDGYCRLNVNIFTWFSSS